MNTALSCRHGRRGTLHILPQRLSVKFSKGPYKRVLFFLEICQISRKFPRSDKNKNTRFLNAICQILKSNFPRFKRSSAMLKIIL